MKDSRKRKTEEKSQAPGGIRTHDLLMSICLLEICLSKIFVSCKNCVVFFFLVQLLRTILSNFAKKSDHPARVVLGAGTSFPKRCLSFFLNFYRKLKLDRAIATNSPQKKFFVPQVCFQSGSVGWTMTRTFFAGDFGINEAPSDVNIT